MKKINYYIAVLICTLTSCVEEFEISSDLQADIDITAVLVVEATVTDEFKRQEVRLTKGSTFANDTLIAPEANAMVMILDDLGNQYDFEYLGEGNYRSVNSFAAETGVPYQLKINTQSGNTYESSIVIAPQAANIANMEARPLVTDAGELGVGIFVNSSVPDDNSRFLRYTFEETYKIIAPLWSPFEIEVLGVQPPHEFNVIPRNGEEQRVCYGTQFSNSIIQSATESVSSNSVQDFLLRFISVEDYIISHRYSILVKQLSQTQDAYGFFETLNEQSSSNDIFSTIQPGFIEGNIQSTSNSNQKVIGFFEVVSVSEERLFFNYEDLFPDEALPPYASNCNLGSPPPITPAGTSPLADAIRSNRFVYVRDNTGEIPMGGPYITALRVCGDCRELGSNIVPDFWEE